MKKIIPSNCQLLIGLGWLIGSLLFTSNVTAQTGVGTDTTFNTFITISSGSTVEVYAETLYIGPGAELDISGELIIYSKYIWIAPTALIQPKDGFIKIANPDDNPLYPGMTGTTTIDGNNGLPIGNIIFHQNPNNIILEDIADPGFGTVNPTGSLSAALHLGQALIFDIDGGDVLLNGNDLIVSGPGFFSGFSADRMISTGNSIAGHIVRLNGGWLRADYLPLGINEGEMTMVFIAGTNDYHVSVTDYSASGTIIRVPQTGIDRAWHIYGGPADQLALFHNSPATDGSSYIDADGFITRYYGGGAWSTGTPEQLAPGVHINTGATALGIPVSGTADGAWLTKTSDAATPLPVKLVSFNACRKESGAILEWVTASEYNNWGYEVERSKDGISWTKISFVPSCSENGSSHMRLDYTFMDNNPVNGQNFYRLKQIDLDGAYEYTRVCSVLFDKERKIVIYPNPVRDHLTIAGLQGNESIMIYDALGRMMIHTQAKESHLDISLNTLNTGNYMINIINADGSASPYKVIKEK